MASIKKAAAADTVLDMGHPLGAATAPGRGNESAQEVGYHTKEVAQISSIRAHMEVYAACGARIGKVDRVEANTIKLTKDDPQAGGQHHFVPLDWVERVDQHVHLNRNAEDAMREWRGEATGSK